MSDLITSQLVEASTQCRRKAFFIVQGTPDPDRHEYEAIIEQRASENRLRFLDSMRNGQSANSAQWSTLELCSNGVLETTELRADCDAVSQPKRRTKRRHQAFEPYIATGTHSVTNEERLRLAFAGIVIGETRRYQTSSGWLIPMSSKPIRVSIDTQYPLVRKAVANIRDLIAESSSDPPPLVLNSHCPPCPFRTHCRAEAENTENLTLLDRITPKLLKRYNDKGIFTITQLSHVFRPRKRRKQRGQKAPFFNVELQALAIRTRKVYLEQTPSIPESPIELYFDIEGIPDEGFQYLIGLVVKDGNQILEHSFWADSLEEEELIFGEFLDAATRYGDAPMYHYGSYEPKALLRAAQKFNLPCDSLLNRLVNVNGHVFGKVYFPARSNSLKDLGAIVGATWDSPLQSGLQSLVWRHRWEANRGVESKNTLLRYNLNDCHALRLLVAELGKIGKAAQSRDDVDFVNDPKSTSSEVGIETHDVFDRILSSAHSDYKRNRIRLRKSDDASKPEQRLGARKGHPRYVRIVPSKSGKVVSVRRRIKCPRREHKKGNLEPTGEKAEHTIIDLAFSKTGCRKTITKYVGNKTHCPRCKRDYLPPAIQRFQGRHFGHCFRAWAVYQRVALRLPYSAIVGVIENLFAEQISKAGIVHFMGQMAEEYSATENLLLKRILDSPFIHVDETKISIRGSQQWVWVLTNGTHVVFRLTETRETAMIQELISGYEGVLVSDFYGGYDAFPCLQQKCWAHLIRDLNDDLWKHPFHREFEKFVVSVRDLIVPIFDDVERFGLKTRNLRKHKKRVDRFYKHTIEGRQTESDLVEKYNKRFLRYREELFVFLLDDGIPWNNNTAERAIRHLAIQRKISGSFHERVTRHYLRLLGIAQTCRFQDKSFLRFLLSAEKDIDRYKERRRPKSSRRIERSGEQETNSDQ